MDLHSDFKKILNHFEFQNHNLFIYSDLNVEFGGNIR